MTLMSMKVGLLPYGDDSGFRFEVSMNKSGKVTVQQLDHFIEMDRNECAAVMDAIDALWKSYDGATKLPG